jgi:hypothetical protein
VRPGTRAAPSQAPDPSQAAVRAVSAPVEVDLGGRFPTAAGALICLGNLIAAHRTAEVMVSQADDGAWWITLLAELDIGRAAVDAAGGQPFLRANGGYVRDRGFGAMTTAVADQTIDLGTLTPCTPLDLVRRAGLRPARPRILSAASVVLPGLVADAAMRRALDLGLEVTCRPVRLTPLFRDLVRGDGSSQSADHDGTLMTRIDLSAVDGQIPPMLLSAFERLPLALVARQAGTEGQVLIQHRLASPLADVHFAALPGVPDAWIMADAAFGCWRMEDLAEPQACSDLVTTPVGYRLIDQEPVGGTDAIQPATVGLAPCRTVGQRTDALLLHDADRELLTLLLEGHPLADTATVILGAERHLLLAPGGLLDTFAVGQALTCIGPGLLYLPTGQRLIPEVPPSARRRLFKLDADHAVVVLDGHGLRFRLADQRPAWSLWAQLTLAIVDQLPGDSVRELLALEPPPAPAQPPDRQFGRPGRLTQATAEELLERARRAEAADDLEGAAALFRQLGDPRRAAHLYERAAQREQEQQYRRHR